ncbi:MAG: threonine/serine exporter family protein, partial [Clostridia bacterium]
TVAAGQMSAAQAVQELIHIQRSYSVRNRMMFVCSGLTSGFFALMFAGGMMEFLLAFLCGVTVYLLSIRLRRMDMFLVMHSLLGGLICALFALIGRALFHTSLEAVIAGSLMPLLPGLAMTSAVRDTMRGDLLSGVTRGVEALLVAGLLATGVAIMLRVGLSLGGVA